MAFADLHDKAKILADTLAKVKSDPVKLALAIEVVKQLVQEVGMLDERLAELEQRLPQSN